MIQVAVIFLFGALLSDASTYETEMWQSRIDEVSSSGGGRVTIPAGKHHVGQLYLKNNVELHLEEGAVLEGVPGLHNYVVHALPFSEGTWSAIVMGLNVTNVAITGRGMIHGHGELFEPVKTHGLCDEGFRPRGVFFYRSKDIRLEDLQLRDAACWGIVLKCCDGMVARRVSIDSNANHNNDGFDIEAKNVIIENCEVDSGDDAYCIKSNDPSFVVENIVVRGCVARSHCNGFKIGTATHGTIRNVRFLDCRAEPPRRIYRDLAPMPEDLSTWVSLEGVPQYLCGAGIGAICIECVDGGTVSDIEVDGVRVAGYQVPIFVRAGRRRNRICGIPPGDKHVLEDIRIRNVTGRAEHPVASTITGVNGFGPKGVVLDDIDIECVGANVDPTILSEPGCEADGLYPEATMFRKYVLPSYGLYVSGAEVKMSSTVRFTVRPGTQESRPAVFDAKTRLMH